MKKTFAPSPNTALIFLRVVVAVLMLIHGITRIQRGAVDDFGVFLATKGFPLGFYLAWAITLFEIIGGVALALGFFTAYLAGVFVAGLIVGMILTYSREGWAIGAGNVGFEYKALLAAVLATIAFTEYKNLRK